jgi:uncharacterized protein YjiS (DUF1127 family)
MLARAIRRFVGAIRHRRELSRLAELDDHMLADLGLKRSDVERARLEPSWRDATSVLERRVGERAGGYRRPSHPRGSPRT